MGTQSSFPYPDGIRSALQAEVTHGHYSLRPAGFIFMCNERTKPQCFRYRVFGLPRVKKEVVERIKPGAKLFLFDFESKYLYGVYEATSEGNTDLEPGAFDGKFPAQVRFRIFKECIPLPEKSFKSAIQENYVGPKFKQELDEKQVESLILLFPPLAAPSSTPMPLLSPNGASAQQMLSSRTDKNPASVLSSGDPCATVTQHAQIQKKLLSLYPYLYPMQLSHAPQVMQPLPTQEGQTSQHLESTTSAPVEHSLQAIQHGGHPSSTISYHYAESQQASFIGGQAPVMQQPYSWYGASQGVVLGNQPVGWESGHHPTLLQREGETAPYQGTIAGYHHELSRPGIWENSQPYYYYSMPTSGYNSSTMQLQAPASGWPQLNVPTSSYYPFQGSYV